MNVSVICPVYNTRSDELKAAVNSILSQQSGTIQELILVDDKSTAAETIAALAEIATQDQRIRLFSLPKNSGPATARNLGLEHASGEWIGFLDADDLWTSDKLSCAETVLSQRPNAQWLIGDIVNFRNDVRDPVRLGVPCFEAGDQLGSTRCCPILTRAIILDGLHLGTCLIRRSAIASRRFDPSVTYGEDLLFLAKLSTAFCADRAPGLSYLFRRGGNSMMYSRGRISARYASGPRAGMRDQELRRFRREYRWSLYDVYKELAVNNLLNGQAVAAVGFALSAYALDPRELRALMKFLHLLAVSDPTERSRLARRYTGREQVVLQAVENLA